MLIVHNSRLAYLKMLKRLLLKAINSLGYQVLKKSDCAASEPDSLLVAFLQSVRSAGFSPSLVYDVGANRGLWSQELLRVFSDAKVVLFEPQVHLQAALNAFAAQQLHAEVRPIALAGYEGVSTFFSSKWDVTSRLSPTKDPQAINGNRYEVFVSTVDAQASADKANIDILKVDVEGEEFGVLEGASSTIKGVSIVVIEVGICCPELPNSALAVTSAMNRLGFDLMGIVGLNPFQSPDGSFASGVIWLADFAFANRRSALHEVLSRRPETLLDSFY